MTTLRLSPKMILALERLYETSGQADFVIDSTAFALQDRGLVTVSQRDKRTSGGTFPEYLTKLSLSGISWCERHFANIRRGEQK